MMPTTTAAEPGANLLTGWDEDGEVSCYPGLRDDHRIVTCGCGRTLLVATLPGEPYRGFRETEADTLPPLVYRWRAVGGRRVAQCCGCAVEERRANRRGGRS